MDTPATDLKSSHTRSPTVGPDSVLPPQNPKEVEDSLIENFSIVVGGPVYDFLLRSGAARFGLPNIQRRIVIFVALTWLPLLSLSLNQGFAYGHNVRIPFLYDFSMYGRFLLALPLLVLAEVVIDPAIRLTVAEFAHSGVLPDDAIPAFEEVLQRTKRLRNSSIPELALLALAFSPFFLLQHEWEGGAISSWHTTSQGLTLAGWWYASFSAPLLRFITYRWAYRYLVWAVLLWRISRLRLILIPTHPDHSAGLDFISLTQRRFGILFCALGCAFAGRVANSIAFEGRALADFKFLMAGFVLLSLITGLAPLTVFAPKLSRVRLQGLLAYGRLANRYTRSFDEKWVHPVEPVSDALLGTGDIQSLADLGNSFTLVDNMTIAPISKRLALQIGAQACLPLIPVIIISTPTSALVHEVLKMVI